MALPRAISFSREKKFTPLPTLRLPMASTSSLEFLGCTVFVGAGLESAERCDPPLEAPALAVGSGGGGGGGVCPMGMGRESCVLSGFCVCPCWFWVAWAFWEWSPDAWDWSCPWLPKPEPPDCAKALGAQERKTPAARTVKKTGNCFCIAPTSRVQL